MASGNTILPIGLRLSRPLETPLVNALRRVHGALQRNSSIWLTTLYSGASGSSSLDPREVALFSVRVLDFHLPGTTGPRSCVPLPIYPNERSTRTYVELRFRLSLFLQPSPISPRILVDSASGVSEDNSAVNSVYHPRIPATDRQSLSHRSHASEQWSTGKVALFNLVSRRHAPAPLTRFTLPFFSHE
ncbi:hypothetical protein NMY22_g4963 [Coprinellus aureogranulatus]|nr:hypothetical protein NMY22_g4963 [Coprinellus aureogranulatus]